MVSYHRRDFAPKLMELNDEVLFGDIWERPGLSKRDRSLITVAALVALYWTNELPFHLVRARENGISKDELAELFTHLAFYAGWPNAMTAVRIAMKVFAETELKEVITHLAFYSSWPKSMSAIAVAKHVFGE